MVCPTYDDVGPAIDPSTDTGDGQTPESILGFPRSRSFPVETFHCDFLPLSPSPVPGGVRLDFAERCIDLSRSRRDHLFRCKDTFLGPANLSGTCVH